LKSKLRYIAIISLLLTTFIVITPIAFAKTRSSYIIDFIYSTQTQGEGFGENYEETAQALEVLKHYGAFTVEGLFGVEKKVDVDSLATYLEGKISDMFEDDEVNLYDLYYIMSSLNSLNSEIDNTIKTDIYEFVNQTAQVMGGFSLNYETNSPTIISTYFAYNIYSLLGVSMPNETIHKNWVLSCNNTDGGYGGNQSLSSNLLTTYYALSIISDLGTIDDLANKTATLQYLSGYYADDSYDIENYGGYYPDIHAKVTLLSSTYYCIMSINMINSSDLHKSATTSWILTRQNFQDGGFSDNYEGYYQELSSVSSTYYAFKSLSLFDSLSFLDENVFMVEFDYMILIILLSIVAIVIVIFLYIRRKRRI
jgi:hypothetical protein